MKLNFKIPKIRLSRLMVVIWPFLFALIVFILIRIALSHSGVVEQVYSTGFYPYIARLFSTLSNLIPFSLWDLFWVILALSLISGLILVLMRKLKISRYILGILQIAALLYVFFYLVWGLNYFRPKIETRLSWSKPKTDEAEFRTILDSFIVHTNTSYTSIQPSDYPEINQLVEDSYKKNSTALGLNYPNGSRRPKTMIFSSFFAKSGVSGYFGPFFNEIHLNYYLLPMEYPYVLAHEKAHQFGITNEAEANFAAFVICTTSEDKRLQYSGYVNLMIYFLTDASQLKDVKTFVKKIDKPVIRDLRFQRSHWQGLRNNTLDHMQTAANNAYLKTNHIEEGVKNYNQVVSLVISWYKNRN